MFSHPVMLSGLILLTLAVAIDAECFQSKPLALVTSKRALQWFEHRIQESLSLYRRVWNRRDTLYFQQHHCLAWFCFQITST